jgi:hypothetical protein
MHMRTLAIGSLALILAALFAGGRIGLFDAPAVSSETSALAAAPVGTPTYISEIGTALSASPHEAARLPASGSGGEPASPLPFAIGLTLAAAGVLLIQTARHIGGGEDRRAV